MGKYQKIAVIYGSDSSEWEVSCRSGEFVASRIDGNNYDVYEIFARFGRWQLVACKKRNAMRQTFPEEARPEIDKTDFSISVMGEKVKFDFAYIVSHGAPGESGELQGYLEILGIPFSSCSSSVSTIAFDKYACKSYIRNLGIVKCAPDVLARKGSGEDKACEQALKELKLPVFVKPTIGGSSFGVTMVKEASELKEAVEFAFSEGQAVMIEEGVHGRELTCGTYFDGKEIKTLPLIEIISENEFFDYDAKYNGHSQEVCPAEIPASLAEEVSRTSIDIYRFLGCKGIVRLDYIASEKGLYFLEANTIPGMTSASLVPRMVRTAGIDITDFLSTIIESA